MKNVSVWSPPPGSLGGPLGGGAWAPVNIWSHWTILSHQQMLLAGQKQSFSALIKAFLCLLGTLGILHSNSSPTRKRPARRSRETHIWISLSLGRSFELVAWFCWLLLSA